MDIILDILLAVIRLGVQVASTAMGGIAVISQDSKATNVLDYLVVTRLDIRVTTILENMEVNPDNLMVTIPDRQVDSQVSTHFGILLKTLENILVTKMFTISFNFAKDC
jgi:hypothetical protein